MRILFIHFGDFIKIQGSVEPRYVYRFLNQKGHEVLAITPGAKDDNSKIGGGKVRFLPRETPFWWKGLPKWFYWDLKTFKVVRSVDAGSFDLIWTYKGTFLTPFWLKSKYGVPWVIDFRTPPVEQDVEFQEFEKETNFLRRLNNDLLERLYRYAIKRADRVLAASAPLKTFLEESYRLDEEKAYVQSLGVDIEKFRPRKSRNFNEDRPKIACVTSISPPRQLKILVKILVELRESGMDAEILLVGDGPERYREELKELAASKGVDDRLIWRGYVGHEKLPGLLDGCDIGISPLPDLFSYRMSSPTKVFEYHAMELPVVASDIEAHREIIEDRETGLLVPPGDPDAWSEAIKLIISDPELREKIVGGARDQVQSYDWNGMLSNLEKSVLEPYN